MINFTQKQIEELKKVKVKSPEHKRVAHEAWIIEETLKEFGIRSRVAEVNIKKNGFEYCVEIERGTSIDKVVKLDRDIAMAVASPTGKVKIQAPIPGRSLIGILVPPGKVVN